MRAFFIATLLPVCQRTGEVVALPEGCVDVEPDPGSGSIGGSGTREVEEEDDDEGVDGEADVTGAGPVPPRCAAAWFAAWLAARSASLTISTTRTTFTTPEMPRVISVARSVSRRVAMPIR